MKQVSNVADLQSYDADIGYFLRLFALMRVQVRAFNSMRFRILPLMKVMEICDHWPMDPLRLHFERSLLYIASF